MALPTQHLWQAQKENGTLKRTLTLSIPWDIIGYYKFMRKCINKQCWSCWQLLLKICCCCSVSQSCLTLCDPMDCSTSGLPVLTISRGLPSSLHQWSRPAVSFSDALFFFCPHSFPASGTSPVSHLFASDDQNTGASASASVLPVNIQSWSPLRLTGLISLLSKGLSGVFSSTTVQRHQFFGILLLYGPALTTIHDLWEKRSLDYMDLCWQDDVSAFQHTV